MKALLTLLTVVFLNVIITGFAKNVLAEGDFVSICEAETKQSLAPVMTKSWSGGDNVLSFVSTIDEVILATWQYPSRSITTIGDLISRIMPQEVTAGQFESSEPQQQTPDFSAKVAETENVIRELGITVDYINSRVGLLNLEADQTSDQELVILAKDLASKFGREDDPASANSVFGRLAYLNESWDWQTTDEVKTQAMSISQILNLLAESSPTSSHSQWAQEQLGTLANQLEKLRSLVGGPEDKAGTDSLFGRIAETKKAGWDSSSNETINSVTAASPTFQKKRVVV